LTSGVVGEFPELQGVMGRYYALNDGEDAEVADAVRDHYKPQGPGDAVPGSKVAIAVALADKLDTLLAFWAVDEKPTGSKDPMALRRAALGSIRLIIEKRERFQLRELLIEASDQVGDHIIDPDLDQAFEAAHQLDERLGGVSRVDELIDRDPGFRNPRFGRDVEATEPVIDDLMSFFADRLKVALREKGTRHDLIDAVFSLGNEDDLVRLVARVEALQAFLKTDDGVNLLAGYKRAANILKAEEKKDGQVYAGEVLESHLSEAAEVALFAALTRAKAAIAPALVREDFAGAMTVMAGLRAPVDAFFDAVKVNADDPVVRTNRLNLLGALRATLLRVADFSKIEG